MRATGRFGVFSGRASISQASGGTRPLVIAIHGGTYTSAYFDVDGHSLLDQAERNGITAIAIDRYGYGKTPFIDDMSILGQAALLSGALNDVWTQYRADANGVVLIGHSIGAAIALGVAGNPGELPLLGIAVSGIGVRTPAAHSAMWNSLPDLPTVEMPAAVKDQLMFGPPGSFDPAVAAASHATDAPVPKAELIDIVGGWQAQAAAICSSVRVPVHYRQAEQDRLWIVDKDEVEAFARRFSAAPRVDAAMIRNTGHCMELHAVGPALQLQQLGFALQCAVERPSSGDGT
ncbi:MAG TPA: alpha/beta hydrolase [Steroidobacteraceae bacterium]